LTEKFGGFFTLLFQIRYLVLAYLEFLMDKPIFIKK